MLSEPLIEKIINSLEKSDGIALDIGANHGIYTAQLAEKFGTVYAFEPHPDNVKILKEVQKAHPNIHIMEKVISKTNGPYKLYCCSKDDGSHTINKTYKDVKIWGYNSKNFIKVPGITLDTFWENLNKPIEFMKVDIEGAETSIFEGAKKMLKNNTMTIILEVHHFVDSEAIYKIFKKLGYKFFNIDGPEIYEFEAPNHYIITNNPKYDKEVFYV